MLRCKNFVFNSFAENTYILWDQDSGEAAIIDPGCCDQDEELRVTGYIETNNIRLKYLINTHCHIDHIFGNNFVKERYDPVFYVPEEDLFLLKNLKQQAAIFGISATPSPMPDAFITEELNIKLGDETGTF